MRTVILTILIAGGAAIMFPVNEDQLSGGQEASDQEAKEAE